MSGWKWITISPMMPLWVLRWFLDWLVCTLFVNACKMQIEAKIRGYTAEWIFNVKDFFFCRADEKHLQSSHVSTVLFCFLSSFWNRTFRSLSCLWTATVQVLIFCTDAKMSTSLWFCYLRFSPQRSHILFFIHVICKMKSALSLWRQSSCFYYQGWKTNKKKHLLGLASYEERQKY